MEKYDEALLSGVRMAGKGFNIVKLDAIAKSTKTVVEAIRGLIEMPQLVLSYRAIKTMPRW